MVLYAPGNHVAYRKASLSTRPSSTRTQNDIEPHHLQKVRMFAQYYRLLPSSPNWQASLSLFFEESLADR